MSLSAKAFLSSQECNGGRLRNYLKGARRNVYCEVAHKIFLIKKQTKTCENNLIYHFVNLNMS